MCAGTCTYTHVVMWIHCYCPFRTSELQERLVVAQEQLRQAESDLEELHGEKSAKYRELKKREETMKGTCTVHCIYTYM